MGEERPGNQRKIMVGRGRKGLDSGTAVPVSQERNESSRVQSCPTTGRGGEESEQGRSPLSRRGVGVP